MKFILCLSFIFTACQQRSTRFNFINESSIVPEKITVGINAYSESFDSLVNGKSTKILMWDKVNLGNHDCTIGITILLKNGKALNVTDYQDLSGRPQYISVDIHLKPDSTIELKNQVYSKWLDY